MASLLPLCKNLLEKNDKGEIQFLESTDTAPAPSKDFCQIYVDQAHVIYRWWKIVPPHNEGRKAPPGEIKDSYDDYMNDEKIQSEIERVFGPHMNDYVMNLISGHIDILPRLPEDVLMRILSYLELEDIARIAQCSKQFRRLCNSNELWEQIYRANSETPVTAELEALAKDQGWKRLFFTNKLQLQMQLRRQARKRKSDNVFVTSME